MPGNGATTTTATGAGAGAAASSSASGKKYQAADQILRLIKEKYSSDGGGTARASRQSDPYSVIMETDAFFKDLLAFAQK